MKFRPLQKGLAVTIIAISSFFAMQANAIPTFTFTEYAGFQLDDVAIASYQGLVSGPLAPVAEGVAVYDTMNWYDNPTDPRRSSLVLATATSPTALAINDWTTITTLTHNNNPIPTNPLHGWDAPQDIFGRLIISDEGGVALDDEDPITITLDETLNDSCATPNPLGSICDDFFTFTAVGLADLPFTAFDGSLWTASFRLANFVNSFFDEIDTVYTAEGETSSLDVQIMLTSRDPSPIPEPATLGILGLGLLGLSIAKRRNQNS